MICPSLGSSGRPSSPKRPRRSLTLLAFLLLLTPSSPALLRGDVETLQDYKEHQQWRWQTLQLDTLEITQGGPERGQFEFADEIRLGFEAQRVLADLDFRKRKTDSKANRERLLYGNSDPKGPPPPPPSTWRNTMLVPPETESHRSFLASLRAPSKRDGRHRKRRKQPRNATVPVRPENRFRIGGSSGVPGVSQPIPWRSWSRPELGSYDTWSSGTALEDTHDHDYFEHLAKDPSLPELNPFGFEGLGVDPGSRSCVCRNTSDESGVPEVECQCTGAQLLDVPEDLNFNASRISVTYAGITKITNQSFQPYKEALQDIVVANALSLSTIEARAFEGLSHLRSLSINTAPALRTLPHSLFDLTLPSLRTLRIVTTSLEEIPNLGSLVTGSILHLIDLESNRIRTIPKRSVRVKVEHLMLGYNEIESIDESAFADSFIGLLNLRGNRKLKHLHQDAFKDIGNLRELVMSETSIVTLPTAGLMGVEVLHLTSTPSLKVFPSVFAFKSIIRASLTYSYHCCAFKFPKQHDPDTYRKHQEFIARIEQDQCSDVGSVDVSGSVITTNRRKRVRPLRPSSTTSGTTTNSPSSSFSSSTTSSSSSSSSFSSSSSLSSTVTEKRQDQYKKKTGANERDNSNGNGNGNEELAQIGGQHTEMEKREPGFRRLSPEFFLKTSAEKVLEEMDTAPRPPEKQSLPTDLQLLALEHPELLADHQPSLVDHEVKDDNRQPIVPVPQNMKSNTMPSDYDDNSVSNPDRDHPGWETVAQSHRPSYIDHPNIPLNPEPPPVIPIDTDSPGVWRPSSKDTLSAKGNDDSDYGMFEEWSAFEGHQDLRTSRAEGVVRPAGAFEAEKRGEASGGTGSDWRGLEKKDDGYGLFPSGSEMAQIDHVDGFSLGSTREKPGPSFPHGVHRNPFQFHPETPGSPNSSTFPGSDHGGVFGPTRIDDSFERDSSFGSVLDPHHGGSFSSNPYPGQVPSDMGYPYNGEFSPSLDYHHGRGFGHPYPENNSGRGILSPDVDSFGDGFADSPLEINHVPSTHDDGNSRPQGIFLPEVVVSVNNETITAYCGNLSRDYRDVICEPEPDAFNPCEDIMGNIGLRVAVWFVVVTAVLGNLAVMLVLLSSKFRLTVSKFLMVNLAFADLCMGVYLLLIAAMDLHTIGVYFNYAIDWQNGAGCKVAGFLTVFASELSIFTLTVITSERWYAITYAIHLNKRLKLSMASKIMVLGWAYALTMASLPLLGVSGYSKTSICLPMETADGISLAYLIILLLVNGLAFVVITACYASMYISISRHEVAATHSDLTVAKRMALLVFTDFACWAPIAFFGLTAVAGLPLIDVTRAKILLVFFYPLNSCANPYLYAILTKQYRHDLFILLARYGICTQRAMRYKGAISSANHTNQHQMIVHTGNHHRLSTLTQITLCELPRRGQRLSHHSTRSFHSAISHHSTGSHHSGTGNNLALTTSLGSQDSLQRSPNSPSRVSSRGEQAPEGERLSTVQEMSHSNMSDEEDLQSSPPPYHGQKDHLEESEMLLSKPYMPLLHNEPSVIISEPRHKGMSGRLLKYDSDSSTSSPELVVTFSKANHHNHKGSSTTQNTVPANREPASKRSSPVCPAQDHQSLPSLGGDGFLHTLPTTTPALPVVDSTQNTFGLPLRPRSANLEGNYIRTESLCPQPEKRAHSWTLIPRTYENQLPAGEGLVRVRDPPNCLANNTSKFPPENITKRNPSPATIVSDGTASPSESLVRSPMEFPYQALECQLDSPPCKPTVNVMETTSTNSLLLSSSSTSSISKAQDFSSSSNGYRFMQ